MRAILVFSVCMATASFAQDDLTAYVPRTAPPRTADDEGVSILYGDEPRHFKLRLPSGTQHVDLLNSRGRLVDPQPPIAGQVLDATHLRPGTYTLRAHTAHGIRVRRFVLLRSGGSLWAPDPEPL